MLILSDRDNDEIVSRDDTNLSTVNWTYNPGSINIFAKSALNQSDDSFNSLRNNSNQTQIVKLNSLGAFQWGSGFLSGSSIGSNAVVDENDESYHGLGDRGSCRKIDSSGSQVWENSSATDRVVFVDYSVQGFLYASSWDGNVYKINTSTGVTARTDTPVAAGNDLFSIYCEPDGTYYVYDTTTTDTVKVDPSGSVVWTKANTHVTNVDADFVYLVDLSTSPKDALKVNKTTGATITSFTGPVDAATEGATNGDGSVFFTFDVEPTHVIKELDTATFSEQQSLSATNQERATAVSPGRYGAGFHITGLFNMVVGSNAVNAMYIGSTAVIKAYKGSTQIFG